MIPRCHCLATLSVVFLAVVAGADAAAQGSAPAAEPPAAVAPLEEIVITASLRATPASELPQSVTVLDGSTLQAAGVQHFGDVLGMVPGLSAAGGTARPRYFQIRGIGEVEQYQGAPNPSVGFLIDDIDFSGLGGAAMLFDLDRIEVLRGPSSTVYGANALAGLINVRSRDPGRQFELDGEATAADYGTGALGLVVGDGRADGTAGWRIAAQRYKSDGFRYNAYLGSYDTNGFDESTVRGKLVWDAGAALHAALTVLYADLNDGYDAWSIDNSRVTESNQPGRDAQRSTGASLRLELATGAGKIISVSSGAASFINYSFDADWGNDAFWGVNAPYDYFEGHQRQRRTLAQDLRFEGDAGSTLFGRLRPVVGVYVLRLRESDAQLDTWNDQYNGIGQSWLYSDYQATNTALYGSLELRAAQRGTLTLGLRAEQRVADYADSSDVPFPKATSDMVGGNLSWLWHESDQRQYYVTLARGYKAGGFNIGAQIDPAQRLFRPEALWNLEVGLRSWTLARNLQLQADLYAMRRMDMQVYTSHQLQPDNPATYVFFTGNAAHGDNIGMESELRWRPAPHWTWSATGALQHTRYLGYITTDGLDLRGRSQAFAPDWQLSVAAEYAVPSGWFARADVQAQDGYYFSASDNQRARSRELVNVRLGWQDAACSVSLWVRNLLQEHYAVYGFYFGDEPPDFPVKSYLQNGDPRQIGVTVRYAFAGR